MLLERILPPWVAVAEAFGDPPHARLLPQEEPVVARAVERRRRAFTTARHCARLALRRLGLPPAAILPGELGAPVWPAGVTGSITHCAGYRAAALSLDALAIGIDAEPHLPLPDGVLNAITARPEAEALRRLDVSLPGVHWDRLLFSAKESVYKAWFPLTRRRLGFRDVDVSFGTTGTFSARFLVAGPEVGGAELGGFSGRWIVSDGFLATAIAIPPHASKETWPTATKRE
jgi:4'-phosphopantetheinyl transferase EntD